MLRTITTKCPCGYVHKVEERIETRIIPASNYITCKPGRRPVIHDRPTKREEVAETNTLEGDEKFKAFTVLTNYYARRDEGEEMKLIVCPKCGTVLFPKIARTIEEKEEE